jgi:ABC-type branched-subunit amino acid transport system substrate-binding protein
VTETEILFGTHQPLTGPASGGYSKIAPATKAYFQYVNDTVGGVYGRKINYKIVDDTYNPATTNTVVRQLIQEDKVFAILNGLGTPTHTGVLDVIKEAKIPDLFVASGATTWNQPSKYPGTFAVNPDYTNEGKILGSYIKTNMAGKKVCHFGQDDDFGRDALVGLEKGLGAPVALKQTYVTSNTNVGPQMSAFKDAGCQVVVTAAIPASSRSPWAPRPASASPRSSSPPASVATTTPCPPRWVRPRACSRASSPPVTCRRCRPPTTRGSSSSRRSTRSTTPASPSTATCCTA